MEVKRITEAVDRTQFPHYDSYKSKYDSIPAYALKYLDSIDYDGYWNIFVKTPDGDIRDLSEETWSDAKWEFLQIVKRNDFNLEW